MTREPQFLLTEDEAAQAMRLCTRTLRNARKSGQLRYILIGRAVRYTVEDLQDYVDSLRQVQQLCPPQKPPAATSKRSAKRAGAQIIPFHLRNARSTGGERL